MYEYSLVERLLYWPKCGPAETLESLRVFDRYRCRRYCTNPAEPLHMHMDMDINMVMAQLMAAKRKATAGVCRPIGACYCWVWDDPYCRAIEVRYLHVRHMYIQTVLRTLYFTALLPITQQRSIEISLSADSAICTLLTTYLLYQGQIGSKENATAEARFCCHLKSLTDKLFQLPLEILTRAAEWLRDAASPLGI